MRRWPIRWHHVSLISYGVWISLKVIVVIVLLLEKKIISVAGSGHSVLVFVSPRWGANPRIATGREPERMRTMRTEITVSGDYRLVISDFLNVLEVVVAHPVGARLSRM